MSSTRLISWAGNLRFGEVGATIEEHCAARKLVQGFAQARSLLAWNEVRRLLGIAGKVEQKVLIFAANQFQVALNCRNALVIEVTPTYPRWWARRARHQHIRLPPARLGQLHRSARAAPPRHEQGIAQQADETGSQGPLGAMSSPPTKTSHSQYFARPDRQGRSSLSGSIAAAFVLQDARETFRRD